MAGSAETPPIAARTPLPPRRLAVTEAIDGLLYSVGFDTEGQVRELFVRGAQVGSDREALLDDACVLLSLLLQLGYPLAALQRHLGREGIDPAAPAASPIGLLVQRALTLQETCANGVREAYAARRPKGEPCA